MSYAIAGVIVLALVVAFWLTFVAIDWADREIRKRWGE